MIENTTAKKPVTVRVFRSSDHTIQASIHAFDDSDDGLEFPRMLTSVWIMTPLDAEKHKQYAQYHTYLVVSGDQSLEVAFSDLIHAHAADNGWIVVDVSGSCDWFSLWMQSQPNIDDDVASYDWDRIRARLDQDEWSNEGLEYDDNDNQEYRIIYLGSEWSITPSEVEPEPYEYDDEWFEPAAYENDDRLGVDPEWRMFYLEHWEEAMQAKAQEYGLWFTWESGDGFIGESRDKEQVCSACGIDLDDRGSPDPDLCVDCYIEADPTGDLAACGDQDLDAS